MAGNGYCPYCGSDDITRYKTIAWKCNACQRIFYTPLAKVALEQTAQNEAPANETETGPQG